MELGILSLSVNASGVSSMDAHGLGIRLAGRRQVLAGGRQLRGCSQFADTPDRGRPGEYGLVDHQAAIGLDFDVLAWAPEG